MSLEKFETARGFERGGVDDAAKLPNHFVTDIESWHNLAVERCLRLFGDVSFESFRTEGVSKHKMF